MIRNNREGGRDGQNGWKTVQVHMVNKEMKERAHASIMKRKQEEPHQPQGRESHQKERGIVMMTESSDLQRHGYLLRMLLATAHPVTRSCTGLIFKDKEMSLIKVRDFSAPCHRRACLEDRK